MNRLSEKGNVLWFILVAVMLLAALTAVLSRGGSSVEQSGDVEQMRVRASHLMRYAKSIETAIQEMKLRGISENDISFENDTTVTDYTNAGCDDSADRSYPDCLLFDGGGAGLSYRDFPNVTAGEWIFTAANNVGTAAGPVGTTAAGSGNDLIMLLPDIGTDLCNQINRDLGVGTPGTIPVETTGIGTAAFTGSYPGGGPVILDGDPSPFELDMQNAGCFNDISGGGPGVIYFYYVVLAR